MCCSKLAIHPKGAHGARPDRQQLGDRTGYQRKQEGENEGVGGVCRAEQARAMQYAAQQGGGKTGQRRGERRRSAVAPEYISAVEGEPGPAQMN